jgi:CHASE3 domain sensor protein
MPTAACAAISCPAPTPTSARAHRPARARPQFDVLKALLADNPSQLKNLTQLQTLVTRRVDLMNQALEVYRHGGLDDIIAISRTQEDRSQMDEIRLQVVIMTGEQNELLATRSAAFYDQYRRATLLGSASTSPRWPCWCCSIT